MHKAVLALAVAAALSLPLSPALAEGKIGFVNTERIMRDSVPAQRAQKKIEEARAAKVVGSSLQAEVILHARPDSHTLLSSLGEDLRFVLITSRVELVSSDEDKVIVVASRHAKCERCWHYREDVGADAQHPQLCGRCTSNLFGKGEVREHA